MNKICTSIEQSKKLLELGIDINTADMHYYKDSFGYYIEGLYNSKDLKDGFELKGIEYIPCWSLAALLGVFPMVVGRDLDMYCCWQNSKNLHSRHYDNPVDACVDMIEKLHELKIL